MEPVSYQSEKTMEEMAQRYGVSTEAVTTLFRAVIAGHGNMAQFSHPELGGMGQWSRGGMTMIGDMFNSALKAKVEGLCSELSELTRREPSSATTQANESSHASSWWGADLGTVGSSGSQNRARYAYFPSTHRLAVSMGDHVDIYDTEDHQISGVSQQQSGDSSLTFVSQRGPVRVEDLRKVSPKGRP